MPVRLFSINPHLRLVRRAVSITVAIVVQFHGHGLRSPPAQESQGATRCYKRNHWQRPAPSSCLAELLEHARRIRAEDVTREPLWDSRVSTSNTDRATPAFISFDTYGQAGNQLLTIMDMFELAMSLGRTLVLYDNTKPEEVQEDAYDRPNSLWGLTYSVAEMERRLAPYGGILRVGNTPDRDRACQAALTNITQFKLDLGQICEGHPALLHLSGEMAWNIGPHVPTMVCINRKRKLDNAFHMAHRPITLRPKPNALSFAMARAMHVRGRQLARSPLRVCAAHVRRFDCESGECNPECRKRWASILPRISKESKCGYWFIATNSPYSESIKLRESKVRPRAVDPSQDGISLWTLNHHPSSPRWRYGSTRFPCPRPCDSHWR